MLLVGLLIPFSVQTVGREGAMPWFSPGTGVEGLAQTQKEQTRQQGAVLPWAATGQLPAFCSSLSSEFSLTPIAASLSPKVQNVRFEAPGVLFSPEQRCSQSPRYSCFTFLGKAGSVWNPCSQDLPVQVLWCLSCVLHCFWSTGPSKGFILEHHPRASVVVWHGGCRK